MTRSRRKEIAEEREKKPKHPRGTNHLKRKRRNEEKPSAAPSVRGSYFGSDLSGLCGNLKS
jgi:hypothetical protein